MAKGQQRSSREKKKPKQTNKPLQPATPFGPAPGKPVGGGAGKKP